MKIISAQIRRTLDSDNAFIKSRIVHQVNILEMNDKRLGRYIREKARIDTNYVIRKIISGIENDLDTSNVQ